MVSSLLQQVYAEVWAGPRNLPLPKPSSREPLGSDTPEGMARLHEAITILNEKHVVFVHKAHYDLQKRMVDLQGEVRLREGWVVFVPFGWRGVVLWCLCKGAL